MRYYTHYTAKIAFPEGEVTCIACPLLHPEYGVKRYFCAQTGEYIPEPEYMRGGGCPLIEEEQTE